MECYYYDKVNRAVCGTPLVLQKGRRESCASQYDIRMMQCNDVMLKRRDIDLISILVFLEYLSN